MASPPVPVNYNPHSYPWGYPNPPNGAILRVVTNFLWWNGAHWTFNSRHYHTAGTQVLNVDAPPGTPAAMSSTQVVQI